MSIRSSIATSALSLTVSVVASAQPGTAPEMVRKDFVLALLNTEGMWSPSARSAIPPEVLVGRTTPQIEREVSLPPGSELLGTIIRNQSADLLAIVPLAFDSARAALEQDMMAKGWTPAPTPAPTPRTRPTTWLSRAWAAS